MEEPPLPSPRPMEGAYAPMGTLGEGGVGIVYLAEQRVLGRPVALKSVRPHLRQTAAERELVREARTLSALEHPNIVPVYDLVSGGDGQPGVVMRRIAGETWTHYLSNPGLVAERFGVRDALTWHVGVLEAVCNAVHFAHTVGVLHRDLKPDNVMIGEFGQVWVLDWGLAARIGDAGPPDLRRADQDDRVVGTPQYMAPEMVAPRPHDLGPRTDIYLLGGLLFAVLAGRPPHVAATVTDTLAAIPAFSPVFPPGTPARLAALVSTAMALDPADRLDSADALRRALVAWQEERSADLLVAAAAPHVERLRAAVAQGLHAEVDRHYAAARVSFEHALAAWPDHPTARSGLERARELAVRHALAQQEHARAALLLAEMAAPPASLVARYEAVKAAAEQARADRDPMVGWRTRLFVFGLFMGIWTVLPLASWALSLNVTVRGMTLVHALNLGLVVALVVWARDSLSRSTLNRHVASMMLAVSAGLLLADVQGLVRGLGPVEVITSFELLFTVLCTVAAVTVHPRVGLAALLYLGAFCVALVEPTWVLPASAVANLATGLIAASLWTPAPSAR